MNLDEARELRKELEAIEAAMERIKALWLSNDFPCESELKRIQERVGSIESTMDDIKSKTDSLPLRDEFTELMRAMRHR